MLKSICAIALLIFPFILRAQNGPLELLTEYVKIKSISGHEKPAGEFILAKCREMGFVTEVFHDKDSSFNFCASLYPLDKNLPNILMINHLDVVPAEDKG